jgi:hypothetical protein
MSRDSDVSAFRFLCWFWIGMGLVYSADYFHVAVLAGHYRAGLLLASFPLLQAIFISVYVWRTEFQSQIEAVIRSASVAVASAGLYEGAYLLTGGFGSRRTSWDSDHLQSSYVFTVLLLAGLAEGAALGVLRWRVLKSGRASQTSNQRSHSAFHNYFSSAVQWIATTTVVLWFIECVLFLSSQNNSVEWGVLFGVAVAGLFFIAPIPIISPPVTQADRRQLTWKYSKTAALVIGAIWLCLVAIGISARNYFVIFVIVGFPYLVPFWIACLSWAFLYSRSVQLPAGFSASEKVPAPYQPARPAGWIIVSFAALGQMCAFSAGLLATAPVSLGLHGIGCLNVYSSKASEYWFWKAYKGISSETTVENRIIIRPSDRSGKWQDIGRYPDRTLELGP